jgi:hypothetical protein
MNGRCPEFSWFRLPASITGLRLSPNQQLKAERPSLAKNKLSPVMKLKEELHNYFSREMANASSFQQRARIFSALFRSE